MRERDKTEFLDIPNWLKGERPQLSRVTNNGPEHYWTLNLWKVAGDNYELRIRAWQSYPFSFFVAADDGCSDWKEVVTHQQARDDCDSLEGYACDEICHSGHEGKPCPNVEAAVQKYVESHYMCYPDAVVWEVKQYLLRHWHALALLVAVGP